MPTRTATVLFTDVVGSVETAARLGPTRAADARRQHDGLLADVITGHDGTVVKGLGDGVMATFASASDAVSASVAIQQAVHRHNRRHPEGGFSVRVGLSGGDVTFEDGDCFGSPVAEASRLCRAAAGGQILAAELVRFTARALVGDPFRPVGDLAVKNWPDRLRIVEVVWDTPEESRTPLPSRLSTGREFVGRHDELGALDTAYKTAAAGEGRQLVLLYAEPGMGKTSVTIQAVKAWHAQGASVGMGACDEELSMPYAPITAALDHLVRHAPPHVLTAHVGRHGGAGRHLVPALARRVPLPPSEGGDPQTERYLGFAAVADVLTALGEDSPVVLVLEDLHWADAATLTLLRHLVANTPTGRLLVLATYRDSEVLAGHPLAETLASLHRNEGVTRLGLGGLGADEIETLVVARAGRPLADRDGELARQLAEETGGNPFYVSELLDHLVETGRLEPGRAAPGGPALLAPEGRLDLPDSIRDVIAARVGRLGPDTVEVLTVAATIGVEFDLPLLCAASGRSEEEALTALDRARGALLVRELADGPGRLAFSHALVAHTLLHQAGLTRQASLHQRVALALEGLQDRSSRQAELAYHWGLAVHTVHARRARDYARRAADEAIEALAPDEAARWYERALELHSLAAGEDVATRVDLLTALGTAQRQAGSGRYRQTLLDAAALARSLGDPNRLAAAMVENNRGMFTAYARIDEEKVALLETALDMADPADLRTRAEMLAILANELTYNGDYPRRRELADEAVGLARRLGRPDLLYRVLNLVFHPLWTPETLHERLATSAESIELARAVGDPGVLFWAEHRHSINLLQAGLIDDADRCLARQSELADRLSQPLHRWMAQLTEAARTFVAGDYPRGEATAANALRLGQESAQPEALTFFQISMMHVIWQSGRHFDVAAGEAMTAQLPGAPALEGGVALLAADGGQHREAAAILERAASRSFSHLRPDPAYLTGVSSFAEVAILLRREEAGRALYETLQPFADQWVFDGIGCAGPVSHFVAALATLLGRFDQAEALFRQTAERSRRAGARFFEARTEIEWARMLMVRGGPGDVAEADDRLARALAVATEKGYAAIGRRAGEMAASLH